jgi:hypothetical protein
MAAKMAPSLGQTTTTIIILFGAVVQNRFLIGFAESDTRCVPLRADFDRTKPTGAPSGKSPNPGRAGRDFIISCVIYEFSTFDKLRFFSWRIYPARPGFYFPIMESVFRSVNSRNMLITVGKFPE